MMELKIVSTVLVFILPFLACSVVKAQDPVVYVNHGIRINDAELEAYIAREMLRVLRLLGNLMVLFLVISPLSTIRRIYKKRSTEKFSYIPYVATLLDCLLAMWYNLPSISGNGYYLDYLTKGFGAIIELFYLGIFWVYAPREKKNRILALFCCVIAAFSFVVIVSVSAFDESTRNIRWSFCGVAVTLSTIATYGSPMTVLCMVMKTKSVEFMPPLLSISGFACASVSFLCGAIEKDKFIYAPNFLGFLLAATQVIVYAVYWKKGEKNKATSEMEEPV